MKKRQVNERVNLIKVASDEEITPFAKILFWFVVVCAILAAFIGLGLGATAFAKINGNDLPTKPLPDPLLIGSFNATGNGYIAGNLIVGENIFNKKRANTRIPPEFQATKLTVHGSANVSGNLVVNGTTTFNNATINTLHVSGSTHIELITATNLTVTELSSLNMVEANEAVVSNLNVTNIFQITNKQRTVVNVGATRPFKTISAALARFNHQHMGDVLIKMDKGTYYDNIDIGSNASSSHTLVYSNNLKAATGISIVGDERGHVGITYIDGLPLEYPSQQFNYVVSTSTGKSFKAVGANFDANGQRLSILPITVNDGVSDITDGCESPYVNGLSMPGKAVLIQRGECSFSQKASFAIAYNASAVIFYQNSDAAPIAVDGSFVNTLAVMISRLDAQILQTEMINNSSMTVSIVPAPTVIFGFLRGTINLIHPNGDLTKLLVNVSGGNPDFEAMGVVQGDHVTLVASSDGSTEKRPVFNRLVVLSVTGNQITFTSPASVLSHGIYDSITFLPNVQILAVNPNIPTLQISGAAGLSLEGVAFVSNPEFVSNEQLRCVNLDGLVSLVASKIVIDVSLRSMNTPVFLNNGARLYIDSPEGYPFYSVIGSALVDASGSEFWGSFVWSVGAQGSAIFAYFGSVIKILNSLQISNFNGLNLVISSALYVFSLSSIHFSGSVRIVSGGAGSPYIGCFQKTSVLAESTVFIHDNKFLGTNVGISLVNEAFMFTRVSPLIQNTLVGISVGYSSLYKSASIGSLQSTIINSAFAPYIIGDNSVFSVFYSSSNAQNTQQHLLPSFQPFIDHAFETHIFSGSFVMDRSMNISTFFSGIYPYVGKKYTLINVNGMSHAITLTGIGTFFEAPGLSGSVNKFTFGNVTNTKVQLYVRSTQRVVIEDVSGTGSFSLVAKRDQPHEPGDTAHAESMYTEYLSHVTEHACVSANFI